MKEYVVTQRELDLLGTIRPPSLRPIGRTTPPNTHFVRWGERQQ